MANNNTINEKLKFQDLPGVPDNQKLTAPEFNQLPAFQKSPVQQISGSLDDTDIIIDGTKNYGTTIVVAGATRTITANASDHVQGNNIKQRYTFNVDCTLTLTNFDTTGNNTGIIAPIPAGTYDFKYIENRNGRNLEIPQNISVEVTNKLDKLSASDQTVASNVEFQGIISGDDDKSGSATDLSYIQKGYVDTADSAQDTRLDNLEENQVTGVETYSTFALLPGTGTLLVSYKVTNDPTSSLNGYYHWTGSAYLKDADLVVNIIEESNTSDAVSGKAVFDFTDAKMNLSLKLLGVTDEFTNYHARLTDAPNSFGLNAINDFINEGLNSGWYAKADIIRILGFNVAADALLNIKADEFNATPFGAPTFVPKLGYIGSFLNFLNSGYTFGIDNVNLTPSDACMLVWQNLKPSDNTGKIIGASTRDLSISDRISIEPSQNDNKLRGVFAGQTDQPITDWFDATYVYSGGLKGFNYDGTTQNILWNGKIKNSAAYTAGYFPTRELLELAGEVRSTRAFWLGDYSFMFAGGSLNDSQHTSLYNATKTLLSKLAVSWNKPTTKKPFYIIAGQSNCGRPLAADIPAEDSKYSGLINGVNIYNPSYFQNSTWNQENVGVNTMLLDDVDTSEFGPEASLGWELNNYTSEDIYIFKHGDGGTSLAVDWSPSSESNKLWQAFIPNIRECIKNLIIDGFLPDFKAFIWMQGEQDATDVDQADAYLTNLDYFFERLNIELALIYADFDLDFEPLGYKKVIGRIQSPRWGTIVPDFQDDFANDLNNNAVIIDTDAYTLLPDNIHFDAPSQIQFGLDIFNEIKDL